MDIIIKSRIDASIEKMPSARLWPMRKLSKTEMRRVRKTDTKRLYIPTLSKEHRDEFFGSFDRFWDDLIKDYSPNHLFWRRAVSSRMQEWELSLSYFLLVLFALAKSEKQHQSPVLVVVSSREEAEVCRQWALEHKWNIIFSDGKLKLRVFRCVQELKSLVRFGCLFILTCRKKFFSPKFQNVFKRPIKTDNVLIATLSYSRSFSGGKYKDPFFGDLQNRLKDSGYESFFITDLLDDIDVKISKDIKACLDVAIITSILSWRQIIYAFCNVLFKKIKVGRTCFGNVDMTKLVIWNARRCTHSFNISAELFYEAVKKICRMHTFSQLISIFEGSVIERAVIQASRECSKGDVCGYSHTGIFELNLRLRLTGRERRLRPEPDYFVCSGFHGRKLLQDVRAGFDAKAFDGCALRYVPRVKQEIKKGGMPNTVLVALDGAWTSSRLLDWIIDCRDLFDSYKVIIRCHPNVPMEGILQQTINILPEHFYVSAGTLDDEIKESLCVLYRHTSVGMQALLNGIPAIHLSIDSPLSSDPLRELNQGKWVVYNRSDLKRALSEIKPFRDTSEESVLDEASQYVQDYFSSPTDERIKQFVERSI
jgi:hypothetical protein